MLLDGSYEQAHILVFYMINRCKIGLHRKMETVELLTHVQITHRGLFHAITNGRVHHGKRAVIQFLTVHHRSGHTGHMIEVQAGLMSIGLIVVKLVVRIGMA